MKLYARSQVRLKKEEGTRKRIFKAQIASICSRGEEVSHTLKESECRGRRVEPARVREWYWLRFRVILLCMDKREDYGDKC